MKRTDERHGSYAGYIQGCRCRPCKNAAAAYKREWREVKRAKPIPEHVHGTINGYQNYGCRCGLCKQAQYDSWHKPCPKCGHIVAGDT